jgi:hypothetical protein
MIQSERMVDRSDADEACWRGWVLKRGHRLDFIPSIAVVVAGGKGGSTTHDPSLY